MPGVRQPRCPYENYIDEVIYFTSDTAIVDSFRTKFDDHWMDTVELGRLREHHARRWSARYDIFPKDPSLNFPPAENYPHPLGECLQGRAAGRSTRSCTASRTAQHTDNMIAAVARGVPVRLITEPEQYRLESRMWHSWNVDRMYMAGVRDQAPGARRPQPSEVGHPLRPERQRCQAIRRMVIFGSSNWTSPSAAGQVEHNIFTTKPDIVSLVRGPVRAQVEQHGRHASRTSPFVPLPPDAPINPCPAIGATGCRHRS